jgi:hypothetical protein
VAADHSQSMFNQGLIFKTTKAFGDRAKGGSGVRYSNAETVDRILETTSSDMVRLVAGPPKGRLGIKDKRSFFTMDADKDSSIWMLTSSLECVEWRVESDFGSCRSLPPLC